MSRLNSRNPGTLGYQWKKIESTKVTHGEEANIWKWVEQTWDLGAKYAIAVIENDRLLSPHQKHEDTVFYENLKDPKTATTSGKINLKKIENHQERLTCGIASVSLSSSKAESSKSSEVLQPVKSSSSDFADPSYRVVPRKATNDGDLCKVFDRLKPSDSPATLLIVTFIKACGGNMHDFQVKKSIQVHRSQNSFRAVTKNFSINPKQLVKKFTKACSSSLEWQTHQN